VADSRGVAVMMVDANFCLMNTGPYALLGNPTF
jgi:hypothetical protein